MAGSSEVLLERGSDGVAVVTLNRPERHNALTLAMWDSLADVGRTLRDDAAVRAVIVRGNGRSFCAGADLAHFDQAPPPDQVRVQALRAQEAYNWLEELPVPTLAVIHGACIGGGLELALACDLRVVASGTRFSLPEVQMGFVPDLGGATRLSLAVGRSRAKDLTWTGRTFTAEDAERWGLADRLAPADRVEGEARELADRIAAAAPLAVRYTKTLIDSAGRTSTRAALAQAAQMAETCLQAATAEQRAAGTSTG